jgi:sulfur-oxidizing protein SoxZ
VRIEREDIDMTDSIKIKTVRDGEGVEVRALINHPMSIGQLDKVTGRYFNAHYIEEVVIALNDEPIIEADWSPGVARNPYLVFRVRDAMPGDKLTLRWKDSAGASDSYETALA